MNSTTLPGQQPPMSKTKKMIIGILTILPGFCFAAYFIFFFCFMFLGIGMRASGSDFAENYFRMMPFLALLMIIGGLLTVIMTIYHIIHISNSTTMSSNDKLVWILIVLILNWIGDVIFWYMKIWKDQKNDPNKSSFF